MFYLRAAPVADFSLDLVLSHCVKWMEPGCSLWVKLKRPRVQSGSTDCPAPTEGREIFPLAHYGRPKIDGELKITSVERRSKMDRWAEPIRIWGGAWTGAGPGYWLGRWVEPTQI